MTMTAPDTYNGWANYNTWNIALYIQNEYTLYLMAVAYVTNMYENHMKVDYNDLVYTLSEMMGDTTPDGVLWDDTTVDTDELTEMLEELVYNDTPMADAYGG